MVGAAVRQSVLAREEDLPVTGLFHRHAGLADMVQAIVQIPVLGAPLDVRAMITACFSVNLTCSKLLGIVFLNRKSGAHFS